MQYREPKVLLFDIENSPLITANWGLYDQNAVWMVQDWHLLCFSYKWDGQKKVHNKSLPDYATYKKDRTNDRELVKDLWKLFDEADIIVAHNGDRFDIRKANAKFIEHGLPVPSGYKTVDTLKIARKVGAFTQNRLDYLADKLGVGRKLQTGGYTLWQDCMAGDEKAWKKMIRYCNQDIRVLDGVYQKIKAWHTSFPDMTLYTGKRGHCKQCQSPRLEKRGFEYLKVKVFQRLRCKDCGAWQRGEEVKHKK